VSRPIGRENRQTSVYWLGEKIQIVTGCFKRDLNEFEKAVEETHEKGSKYRSEYDKLIETIKYLIK
jgi:hypothetical protein